MVRIRWYKHPNDPARRRPSWRRSEVNWKNNWRNKRGVNWWEFPRISWWFQWESQDPKLEVLYHIRPYFLGISQCPVLVMSHLVWRKPLASGKIPPVKPPTFEQTWITYIYILCWVQPPYLLVSIPFWLVKSKLFFGAFSKLVHCPIIFP